MRRYRAAAHAAALLMLASGCTATTPEVQPTQATPVSMAAVPAAPPSLRWSRASAEHRALFLQVYRAASDRILELAPGLGGGSWAVVLDADETVLDNSTYQLRLARQGATFSDQTWNAWVREQAATALPGAVSFIRLVGSLGGHVVIVTNRDQAVCAETEANLRALRIEPDLVLCQRPNDRGKNARFDAVRTGTASVRLPPLDVVLWIGDNIRDFPSLEQDIRTEPDAAFSEFGRRFFLLPNPMYGSWESNPIP